MKGSFSFFGLPLGITSTFWFLVGHFRSISEGIKKRQKKKKRNKYSLSDIAVIIPAHNEEKAITPCIRSVKQSLKPNQIYIASDGSTDKTYQMAKKEGCHVANIMPGKGKAKALVYTIKRFRLYQHYKFVMILDADTRLDKNYLPRAISMFNDPDIAVVFPSARIHWPQHIIPKFSLYLISYRERLNRLLQFFYMYGQTWKYLNASYVAPGFATIYRSRVLKQLEIDTPGLLIEDFNLAFQLHKRKLGKMGYDPSFIGWDQHPDNLRDYWKQVQRWNIGFFQTVRKNGIWLSFFYFSMVLFSLEVWLNTFFILCLPFLLFYYLIPLLPNTPFFQTYHTFYSQFGLFRNVPLMTIVISTFLFDYLMTVVIGLMGKKPQFIFYGLFYFFMHYVTSLILLSSIIPGFFGTSDGKWVSPKRLDKSLTGVS